MPRRIYYIFFTILLHTPLKRYRFIASHKILIFIKKYIYYTLLKLKIYEIFLKFLQRLKLKLLRLGTQFLKL